MQEISSKCWCQASVTSGSVCQHTAAATSQHNMHGKTAVGDADTLTLTNHPALMTRPSQILLVTYLLRTLHKPTSRRAEGVGCCRQLHHHPHHRRCCPLLLLRRQCRCYCLRYHQCLLLELLG